MYPLLLNKPVKGVLSFEFKLKCVDYIQHSYKCPHCSENGTNDKIIKAPVPKAPLNHNLGSSTIIAHVNVNIKMYKSDKIKMYNYSKLT